MSASLKCVVVMVVLVVGLTATFVNGDGSLSQTSPTTPTGSAMTPSSSTTSGTSNTSTGATIISGREVTLSDGNTTTMNTSAVDAVIGKSAVGGITNDATSKPGTSGAAPTITATDSTDTATSPAIAAATTPKSVTNSTEPSNGYLPAAVLLSLLSAFLVLKG